MDNGGRMRLVTKRRKGIEKTQENERSVRPSLVSSVVITEKSLYFYYFFLFSFYLMLFIFIGFMSLGKFTPFPCHV